MRKEFEDQLSRWTLRLPFSGLRARLLLLLFLALPPAYGFILYSSFEARQQAAGHARENALRLTHLMAMDQKRLITDRINLSGRDYFHAAITKVTGVSHEASIGMGSSNYCTEPEKIRDGYQQAFAKGSRILHAPKNLRTING